MNIELLATTALNERLAYCRGLSPYVNVNDKEPLWDGHIYIYPNADNKSSELIDRVPIQVKGITTKINEKKKKLSFPVEVFALKKYFEDGGLIYFVVALEGRIKKIFYRCLLPYDLHEILKNAKKQKNIKLRELPDDDDTIRQIFLSFSADKKRQAAKVIMTEKDVREAVKSGATMKFNIQTPNNPKNYFDILRETTISQFYAYVETKEGFTAPFLKVDEESDIMAATVINQPVFVGDVKFYDNFKMGYENGKLYLYIGENFLRLPGAEKGEEIIKHTFKYSIKGTLNERIKKSAFLLALSENKIIRFGDNTDIEISMDNIDEIEGLRTINTELNMIKSVFDYFGVHADLEMDKFTNEDYLIINHLISVSLGNTVTFKESSCPNLFYRNEKIGNITIRQKAVKEENSDTYKLYNAFSDKAHCKIELIYKDGIKKVTIEPWSLFLYMKAEDFLCANIDYGIILSSIEEMNKEDLELPFWTSEDKAVSANGTLLSIISAYDSLERKNKNLLQFAIDFADTVYRKTEDPVTFINKMQAIRRQRPLVSDEIASLVNLRGSMGDNRISNCAIAILLGEIDKADQLLNELSDEDRKPIVDYPIYKLLTEMRDER